jgi:6,7-dimethyl-8-ribityllumazine synthase
VDTDEQAMARSVPGGDNKGYHAAQAAVDMARIVKGLG